MLRGGGGGGSVFTPCRTRPSKATDGFLRALNWFRSFLVGPPTSSFLPLQPPLPHHLIVTTFYFTLLKTKQKSVCLAERTTVLYISQQVAASQCQCQSATTTRATLVSTSLKSCQFVAKFEGVWSSLVDARPA